MFYDFKNTTVPAL